MAEDDLEPVDLEPVDLEPGDDAARFERRRDRRPAWIWIGLAGVGLAAWAAIALTTRGGHARPAPTTPTSQPQVDRVAVLAPVLRAALQSVGSGRFAAVIDDRLYVFDDETPSETLVALPEGHATIAEQSGSNLLVSTFEQTLVSTRPVGTRTLSARDVAIRAVTPGRWWLLHDDGTLRLDHRREFEREPAGLRVVGAVQDGFVALDSHSAWVLWSNDAVRPIEPVGAQILTTGPRTVAFKNRCSYYGCVLEIVDPARGIVATARLSSVPDFAAFSPDGTRLALASTLGDVSIVDAKTGETIAETRGRESASPSRPFTWTPDGYALLVVQDHDIAILRASDGFMTRVIDRTDGVQQVAALP